MVLLLLQASLEQAADRGVAPDQVERVCRVAGDVAVAHQHPHVGGHAFGAEGGTVIFFSMATNFAAAALGAEGLAADVTMLVGNGYVPGHADHALRLLRDHGGVRRLFEERL